mmetsp:Transcript_65391/g.108668  ORF Transcript_65391/g.108668 Transcript_65391/m.108668 type:complete len:176 (+) Transcript_65391:164-691(+)
MGQNMCVQGMRFSMRFSKPLCLNHGCLMIGALPGHDIVSELNDRACSYMPWCFGRNRISDCELHAHGLQFRQKLDQNFSWVRCAGSDVLGLLQATQASSSLLMLLVLAARSLFEHPFDERVLRLPWARSLYERGCGPPLLVRPLQIGARYHGCHIRCLLSTVVYAQPALLICLEG